jgi:hypothetical protein
MNFILYCSSVVPRTSSSVATHSDLPLSLLTKASSIFSTDFWHSKEDSSGASDRNHSDNEVLSSTVYGRSIEAQPHGKAKDLVVTRAAYGGDGLLSLSTLCSDASGPATAAAMATEEDEHASSNGVGQDRGVLVRRAGGGLELLSDDVGLNTVMYMKRFLRWSRSNAVIHRSKAFDGAEPSSGTIHVTESLTSCSSSPSLSVTGSPKLGARRGSASDALSDDKVVGKLRALATCDDSTEVCGISSQTRVTSQRPTTLHLTSANSVVSPPSLYDLHL